MDDETEVRTTETTTNQTPSSTTRQTTSSVGGTPSGIVMFQRFVYWLVGILESLLAIRIVLSLFGANRLNPFADFVYGITTPFVAPFQSLFNYQMKYGFARFELETIVAILVYAMIAYGILALLQIPRRTSTL